MSMPPLSLSAGPSISGTDSQTQAGTWFGDFNPIQKPDNTKYYIGAFVLVAGLWIYTSKKKTRRK